MATPVRLPLMGMTMEEGVVTNWLVEDGARVTKGQDLVEFETDKINATVEAPADGVLGGIAAQAGDTVAVQGLLAYILDPGEQPPAPAAAASARAKPTPDRSPDAGSIRSPETLPGSPPVSPAAAVPAAPAVTVAAPAADGRIKASPLARRVAQDLGVDLATVPGSGPGGRILEKDARAAATAAPALRASVVATPLPTAGARAGSAVPMAGVRRVIADRMTQSLRDSAQVTLVADANAERLHDLREDLVARHADGLGFKLGYNDLLLRICARALQEHPRLNATLDGDQIRLLDHVNIGIAVEAGDDLVVPNIKQAEAKSLTELATDLRALVDRAGANELTLDDISGGTFTITNLGLYGIDAFTPVINPPEAAILGVGQLRPKPVVVDGAVAARMSVTLSLTFDHRIVDGGPAARFLARIKELIEQPYLLL